MSQAMAHAALGIQHDDVEAYPLVDRIRSFNRKVTAWNKNRPDKTKTHGNTEVPPDFAQLLREESKKSNSFSGS